MTLRHRSDYLTDWEWIEHSVPLDPGPEYDRVLSTVVERIGTPDESQIELLAPDLADQAHAAQRVLAAFPHERGRPYRVLPEWAHLRTWLTHPSRRDELAHTLRTGHLKYALEGAAPSDDERRRIVELLHTELEVDGTLYVLNEGTVYRVHPDYLAAVNDTLSAVPTSTFPFPSYRQGTEGAYLLTAPERRDDRLAMLDCKNIYLPGESAFEPCDLVTDDGTLVFAKPKGRSSHFSHLATQAVTSAAMLRNVPLARSAFLERVREATTGLPNGTAVERAVTDRLERMGRGVPQAMTVCLLILGSWTGTPSILSLPLQSRVSLRTAARELRNLGYRVEFAYAGTPPRPAPPRRPAARRPSRVGRSTPPPTSTGLTSRGPAGRAPSGPVPSDGRVSRSRVGRSC